jgi:hypothetical protein
LNALKSKGPVTPEGKQAVRFNALKTVIDATQIIVPGSPRYLESPATSPNPPSSIAPPQTTRSLISKKEAFPRPPLPLLPRE